MTTLCAQYEENGTLARYVARDISDDEAADFEDHYLTCERCQRSIEVGSTVRASDPAMSSRRRFAVPAILLTAAAAGGILLGVQGWQRANVRSLGILEAPPVYLGAEMRAGGSDAAAQFERAMRAYAGGNYSESAQQLRVLEQNNPEPALAFFRGASLLMQRDARAAHAEFTKVIDSGDGLYRDEGFFYRAKASLLMGDQRGAEDDLRLAARSTSGVQPAAAQLLERLSK